MAVVSRTNCTCLMPDEPPKRPDPAIYSQAELVSLGLAPGTEATLWNVALVLTQK